MNAGFALDPQVILSDVPVDSLINMFAEFPARDWIFMATGNAYTKSCEVIWYTACPDVLHKNTSSLYMIFFCTFAKYNT